MLIKYKQKWPFVALVNFPSMVLINPDIAQSQAINLCLFPTALNGWIIEQELLRKTYVHTQTRLQVHSRICSHNPAARVWSSDDIWWHVDMWTCENVSCLLLYQALNYFLKSVNNVCPIWLLNMGQLTSFSMGFLNSNLIPEFELQSKFKEVELK